MPATATAPATWTLRGITAGRSTCDHCGRSLARLFRVESPDGVLMTVGRTCSQRLTGYSWQVRMAERAQAHTDAAARHPELVAALRVTQAAEDVHGNATPQAYNATTALCALADAEQGRWYDWQGDVLAFIATMFPELTA